MKTIKADELKKMLDEKKVSLIDVREPFEHNEVSIENSVLLPLKDVDVSKLPASSKPIVMLCRSGSRSAAACQKLLEQNTDLELYSLEGGITAWQKAGLSVNKTSKNTLSVERQTQIVIGSLVFLGILLGTFASSVFYLIPLFISMGLMFAGITGWCGMAILISKMPWNK